MQSLLNLKIPSIIAIFASLFLGILFSQNTSAATSLSSNVTLQNGNNARVLTLQQWATDPSSQYASCKNYKDTPAAGGRQGQSAKKDRTNCLDGYKAGYNKEGNRDSSCKNKGEPCQKGFDGGANLIRAVERGNNAASRLSDEQLEEAAKAYCAGESASKPAGNAGRNQDSPRNNCIKGYKAGYKGTPSKNATCGSSDVCKAAWDFGDQFARGQNDGTRPDSSGTTDDDGDIPCIGGAMGWIMCPIINYMADAVRAVAGFIDGMMQFKLLIGSESGKAIREAMNNFIGLANIILVIAFLFIIFSQSTSLGLSNYNIKRMLPRIVVAAVLINLSFYICAFAVDISNIVGNSILGLISGQGTTDATISQGIADSTKISGPGAVQNVFGGLLAAAIGVVLLIIFFTPLVLGVILTFVILVARQVILLFLVIVAPLAFAAWLLPNTESWFKKWKDLFVNMLMAYPIIMTVFGVALFASKFLSNPAIQNSETSGLIGGAAVGPLIALVILAIPLLALPFILKSSNSLLARVGSAAQNFGGKQVSGALGSGVKNMPGVRSGFEMMEQRKAVREQAYGRNKAKRAANRVGGRLRGAAIGGVIPTKTALTAHEMMAGQAASASEGIEKQEIDNRRAVMRGSPNYATDSIEIARQELLRAHQAGDKVGVRAALAELSQSAPGTNVAHSMISGFETGTYENPFDGTKEQITQSMSEEQRQAISTGINDNWGSFKDKDAAIAKWTEGNSMGTVEKSPGTYDGLTAKQISSQTPAALEKAVDSGGVSPEMAASILNSDAQTNLSSKTRTKLESIVASGGTPPGSGPTPGPGAGPSSGPPPSSGGSGGWGSPGGSSTSTGSGGSVNFNKNP